MDYETIKTKLKKYKGRWPELAERGGMPYRTLKKVADGTVKNPTIDTLNKIAICLKGFR